jgi:hypothetical protein
LLGSAASAAPPALVTFGGVEESRVVPKDQTLGYMDAGPHGLVYVPNSTSGEVLVLNAASQVVRRWGLTGPANDSSIVGGTRRRGRMICAA